MIVSMCGRKPGPVNDLNYCVSFHRGRSSVQFSHSVVSDSLQPHEMQHARSKLVIINWCTVRHLPWDIKWSVRSGLESGSVTVGSHYSGDARKDWGQEKRATEEDGIINSMDMSLSKLWEIDKEGEAWNDAFCRVVKNQTELSNWTPPLWGCYLISLIVNVLFHICEVGIMMNSHRVQWRLKSNLHFIAKGLENYSSELTLFLVWSQSHRGKETYSLIYLRSPLPPLKGGGQVRYTRHNPLSYLKVPRSQLPYVINWGMRSSSLNYSYKNF